MDPYLLIKWLHILSSTVLFGTGIGTAFQMVWAMRGGTAGGVAKTAAGVVLADWIFTTPAGIVQPLTGFGLIHLAGYGSTESWLVLVYCLYALAFVCWVPVVNLQLRIRDLCRAEPRDAPVPDRARRLYHIWFALGWPAFAALIAIFWLMVAKPVLW